jgi:hypothetical protein
MQRTDAVAENMIKPEDCGDGCWRCENDGGPDGMIRVGADHDGPTLTVHQVFDEAHSLPPHPEAP